MIEVRVPDGQSGIWKVDTFTIDAGRMPVRMLMRPGEYIAPGTYKRLCRGGTVVMSNTPMEIRTNMPIIRAATGDVLINGLGLGMVLTAILAKPDVRSVTVIENSEDVIALVGPTFSDDSRVRIIHDDAMTFAPTVKAAFHAVWHDIWDNICVSNLDDMRRLHRRYGRRALWQQSWARGLCEAQNRRW